MIERQLSPCHLAYIVFALAQREKAGDDIGIVYFAYKFGDIPGMYTFNFEICYFDLHFYFNMFASIMYETLLFNITTPKCYYVRLFHISFFSAQVFNFIFARLRTRTDAKAQFCRVLSITGIAWRRVLQEDGIRAAQMIRTLKRLKHEEAQREVDNAPPGIPAEIANANLANAEAYDDTEEEEQEKNEPSTSQKAPKK